MALLEVILILAGLAFVFGSFMVSEKLSPKDIEYLSKVTHDRMNDIVNKGLSDAKARIDTTIDDAVAESAEKVSREMEALSNDKVMNIKEYSDGVVNDIHKAHEEVMFLYDMLNGKKEEFEKSLSEAKELDKSFAAAAAAIEKAEQTKPEVNTAAPAPAAPKKQTAGVFEREAHVVDISNELEELSTNAFSADIDNTENKQPERKKIVAAEKKQPERQKIVAAQKPDEEDSETINEKIIDLHRRGWSEKDIASLLEIGVGEVRLVVSVYSGGR
ncbi:MAG: hypothetical protein K6G40_07185 [Eubacterium sp.]|nr:hypothetical protein [Eubacterium sp.]